MRPGAAPFRNAGGKGTGQGTMHGAIACGVMQAA